MEYFQRPWKWIRLGGKYSALNAIIGSLLFSILLQLSVVINSYRLKIIPYTNPALNQNYIKDIPSNILLVALLGTTLALVPALIGRGFLQYATNLDFSNNNCFANRSIFRGVIVGFISGLIISLPIVTLFWWLFLTSSHGGNISVQIYDAISATTIASIMGGLTGKQIHNYSLKKLSDSEG